MLVMCTCMYQEVHNVSITYMYPVCCGCPQILELCVAFCHVPGIRRKLVGLLLKLRQPVEEGEGWKGRGREDTGGGGGRQSPLFLSLLNWACQSADAHWMATFTALDLLREVFEVCLLVMTGEN